MSEEPAPQAPPLGWHAVALKDVATIAFSSVDKHTRSSEPRVHLCNYLDVYQNDYIREGHDFMEATATRAEIDRFALQSGDVVITKDSETPDDIGVAALIESVGGTVVCGYHLAFIRPKGKMNSLFLAKQLGHERARRYFAKTARGSTRYGLSKAALEELSMWQPPRKEQDRIAEVLEVLDEAIRKTRGVVVKLRQTQQGLLNDLLTRGVDEEAMLRPSPNDASGLYQDSPLGIIPRAWHVVSLSHVVPRAEYGISSALGDVGCIPILRMNNLRDGEMVLSDLKYSSAPEARRLPLRSGDVLFNRTNSIEHVGRSAIWRDQLEGASFASYLVRLVNDRSMITDEYLNRWLNLATTQIRMRRFATPGVQQVNINPTNLRRLDLAIPKSITEQDRITHLLDVVDHRVHSELACFERLQLVKSGLADDLLTGHVRVSVLGEAGP